MYKNRVRVILILVLGGFLMVTTRLFYLQIVRGSYYRDYAANVHVDTLTTEASRGRIRAAGGELLAFDEPAFNLAMVPRRVPQWRELCRPVLKLYSLNRRERIVALRDVTIIVTDGPGGDGYAVNFGVAATFLRREGTELVRRDEQGRARVVVPANVAKRLEETSRVVGAPPKEMLHEFFTGLALVGRGWRRLSDPCIVARDVGFLAATEVESNADRYPGFQIAVTPRRSYPYDGLACHALGHMQRVSATEYARWHQRYAGSEAKRFLPDDMIGRAGIERTFDAELRASRGVQTVEVDAARRTQRILDSDPAQPGADVVLTIDCAVQGAAEAALEGQVGAVVVMEVATGRLLAIASAPGFNPNDLPHERPDPDDPLAPLLNRAIQGRYPLGSAFKLLLATAALQENRVLVSTTCNGSYQNRNCRNHHLPMEMDLHDAIKRSCNVYFYRTACERLGIRLVAKWGALFGLGECTGVALPGERPGLMPTPAWKQRRYNERWYRGDTLNLAIGQGYLQVTPIQVARLVAAVANGGRLVRPRLVDRMLEADGTERVPDEGETVPELHLDPAKMARLHRAMRGVCHEMGGTARRAWLGWPQEQGYEVAGKTSTADAWIRGTRSNVGWFVGFAPCRSPRVAFVVTLEHEDSDVHGGDVAAPCARRVLERLPERYLEDVPGRDLRDRARQRLAQWRGAP